MSEADGKTRREHLQDALEHARAMREEWLAKLTISPTDTYTKQKFHAYDKRVRWYEREIKRGKMMDWIPGTPRPND